jgi:hypothetical protein
VARGRPWLLVLVLVAAGYSGVQFALNSRDTGLGWDEAVYISQFADGVPPAVFGASRAHGLPLLLAPVDTLTSSILAIRVYLTLLSGVGLVVAFWPWLRLRDSAVVPLAAFLFASTWLSIFYGGQAMPSLYVAFGAIAAVGLFGLSLERSSRAALFGLVTSFAFLSLVRPTDSLLVAAPLVAGALLVRRWRRPAPIGAIAAGLAIGWGAWIVDAFARFGDPLSRLNEASSASDSGLHFTLGEYLRGLDGPLTCGFSAPCGPYPVVELVAFAALVGLAGVGVHASRRAPALEFARVAAVVAAVFAGVYILFVGFAVPRFLLPVWGLLAIPAAEGLRWLVRPGGGLVDRRRLVLATAGVLAFGAAQVATADRIIDTTRLGRANYVPIAHALERQVGVGPPCFIWGYHAVEPAYTARCESGGSIGDFDLPRPPTDLRDALAAGKRVVIIAQRPSVPWPRFRGWTRTRLHGIDGERWYAYTPAPPNP